MTLTHVKKWMLGLGMLALLLVPASKGLAAEAVRTHSSPISAGVVQETYQWDTSYGNIQLQVLRCDLTNPGFDIRVIPGAGEYTQRATVSQMASATNAVAMTNGDFFNTALQGSPIGPSIVDGRLASSPAVITGLFSLGIDSAGKARIEPMIFNGTVTAPDGASFPIDGLNKTYYWHDPSGQESHTDTIQMYNDFWGSPSRGHRTNSELLVNAEGVVERIDFGNTLPYEVPDTKTILQVNGKAEAFIKEHVKVGDTLRIDYGVAPDAGWTFLVGGHGLVADQYQMTPYVKDLNVLGGVRARTFAGVSEDGHTLWLVTAEGRTNRSAGITLSSMGYFMQQLGVYRAVNLDGGGSTAMVAKPLGAFKQEVMTYPENYAAERPVVNGIGIFNTAPIGPVTGFEIAGPGQMVVGESAAFHVAKAWDANYHPHDPNESSYTWQAGEGAGAWSGSYFLALQSGDTFVQATNAEGVAGEIPLRIQGAEVIRQLQLRGDTHTVTDGTRVSLELIATMDDGRQVVLSPQVANWHVAGFDGPVDNINGAAILSPFPELPMGYVIAQIGDKQAAWTLYNKAYQVLEMTVDQRTLYLNGTATQMDVAPHIINNRTMVPLRFVTEALGGAITWNEETRTVHLTRGNTEIEMVPDRPTALLNGETVSLDSPAVIVADRTMVPIRFVSEAMGMEVAYDDATRMVRIIMAA